MLNKKIILLLFVISFVVSCKKEMVAPCEQKCEPVYVEENSPFVPNLTYFGKNGDDSQDEQDSDKPNGFGNTNSGDGVNTTDSEGNITDPNQDPDASKRKGKK